MSLCSRAHRCTVYVHLKGAGGGWTSACVSVCVSGDGGELFEQDALTQCVQGDVLPHIQTDGAHLETDTGGRSSPRQRHTKGCNLYKALAFTRQARCAHSVELHLGKCRILEFLACAASMWTMFVS